MWPFACRLGLLAALLPVIWPPAKTAQERELYHQDFAKPESLKEFVFTDAQAWKWSDAGGRYALELYQQSRYRPSFRSPFNIALVAHQQFGDFVLECDCQQTGREYGHRDMVFVFGFQGPDQFYYAHVASKADDHANQIFIVDRAARRKLPGTTNAGNNWGLNVWHRVRLERRASTGSIRLFFDDMAKPIMEAEDKTFGLGWVGVGSFDDTGRVTNLRVRGTAATAKTVSPFPQTKPAAKPPSLR